jgi:hypothetical protein
MCPSKLPDGPASCRCCEAARSQLVKAMTDTELLVAIQQLLDGVEWTPDTLERIAELLNANGYRIPDQEDR